MHDPVVRRRTRLMLFDAVDGSYSNALLHHLFSFRSNELPVYFEFEFDSSFIEAQPYFSKLVRYIGGLTQKWWRRRWRRREPLSLLCFVVLGWRC